MHSVLNLGNISNVRSKTPDGQANGNADVYHQKQTCSLWLKEPRLEWTDAKPWGRSPSRWTPCWTGREARGFSPISPGC